MDMATFWGVSAGVVGVGAFVLGVALLAVLLEESFGEYRTTIVVLGALLVMSLASMPVLWALSVGANTP